MPRGVSLFPALYFTPPGFDGVLYLARKDHTEQTPSTYEHKNDGIVVAELRVHFVATNRVKILTIRACVGGGWMAPKQILDAAGSRKQGGDFAVVCVCRSVRLQFQVVIEDLAFKEQRPGLFDKLASSRGIDRGLGKQDDRARQVPHAVLQFHHALDDLRDRRLRFDDGVELYLTRN